MAISFTSAQDNPLRVSLGSQSGIIAAFDLDNSYPTGGYSLPDNVIGLGTIMMVVALEKGGYAPFWNYATNKLQVFVSAAVSGVTGDTTATNGSSAVTGTGVGSAALSTITGEVVAVNAGTGVAAAVAGAPTAIFNSIKVTASGIGAFIAQVVPAGAGVASGQVSINYTTGVMTFLIADAVTSATVDYVQRAAPVVVSALTATAAAQVQVAHHHSLSIGAGAMAEVANGADLSAVTAWKLLFIGNG